TNSQLHAIGTYSDMSEEDISDKVLWSSQNSAVATVGQMVEPGLVSALQVGSTSVKAELDGNSDDVAVTVTAAVLTGVEIEPGSDTLPAGLFAYLTAYAVYSDNDRVELSSASWSCDDESVAVVSAAGRVTTLREGQTVVRATFEGKVGEYALTVTDVSLEELVLSETYVSLPKGLSTDLTVEGRFSDGSVRDMTDQVFWSTRAPSIAHVTNEGRVTARSEGTTRLRVVSPLGPKDEIDVRVNAAELEELRIVAPSSPVPVDLRVRFAAEGTYSDGTVRDLTVAVSWSRDNGSVGSFVSGDYGLFSTEGVGTTMITAKVWSGTWHEESVPFEVADIALEEIQISPESLELPVSLEHRFSAMGIYANGRGYDLSKLVQWSWSGTGSMYVSNSGNYIGVIRNTGSPGSGSVVATYNGVTGMVPVTVTSSATLSSVTIAPADVTVGKGEKVEFRGTAHYSNGYSQALENTGGWDSTVRAVGSPSSNGNTTAGAIGTTTISLTYRGVTGTTQLTVTDATLQAIKIVPSHLVLPFNLRYRLVCIGSFSDDTERDITDQVTWTSDDLSVATVSNSSGQVGTMTTVEAGICVVTAVHHETALIYECGISVERKALTSLALDSGPTYLRLDTDRAFKAEGRCADGTVYDLTQAVEWSSSLPTVATIGDTPALKGRIQGQTTGETSLTMREPVSGLMAEHTVELSDSTLLAQADVMEDAYHLQRSPDGTKLHLMGPRRLETRAASDLSLLYYEDYLSGGLMDVSPDGSAILYGRPGLGGVTLVHQSTFLTNFYPIAGVTDTSAVAYAAA
ncbi:MAG: Ig-like domain-containing protein, partial [Myxococcales bacterium]|nr:Ig-like domain-containing protein [Myxococcales bacterium]